MASVEERVTGERRSMKVFEEGWIVERRVSVLLDMILITRTAITSPSRVLTRPEFPADQIM